MALYSLGLIVICWYLFEVQGRSVSQGRYLSQPNFKKILPTASRDEYDCFELYKQPAFNHPLLKNHKIQMRSRLMEMEKTLKYEDQFSNITSKVDELKGGCPAGMVPIMRMKNNNLQNSTLTNSNSETFHKFTVEHPGQHFATVDMEHNEYHGAWAEINLYNPTTVMDQISGAFIWLQVADATPQLNSIQVGWAVHPKLYGDNLTRLTAYWTADNYQKSGCYNTMCPGFVQVHPHLHLGSYFANISTIGGSQFVADFRVYQDKSTRHWWLTVQNDEIGYWPKEIFTLLGNEATLIRYGGWTYNSPDGISPPMGSGQHASLDDSKACFFSQVKYALGSYDFQDIHYDRISYVEDNTTCYDVKAWGNQGSSMGQTFNFGGPGGYCGVP